MRRINIRFRSRRGVNITPHRLNRQNISKDSPLDTESSHRIRLILAYDGTDFHGWQKQPSGTSVQDHLETALNQIFNTKVSTVGSGRTDSGVHALEQNVHFDIAKPLNHPDLLYAINRLMPRSIRVQRAFSAPKQFHAQISATSKLYRYRILQSKVSCPIRRQFVWWPGQMLGLKLLNDMAAMIVGEMDFKSFQSTGTKVRSTIRQIFRADWQIEEDELIFEIEGSGFLKQMVRNIVGAMVGLHIKSKAPIEDFRSLKEALDRTQMGAPALASGLCLVSVSYPVQLEEQCISLPKKISY